MVDHVMVHLMEIVVERSSPSRAWDLPMQVSQHDPSYPAGMEAVVKVEECPDELQQKMGQPSDELEYMDEPEEEEEEGYHVIQVRSFAKKDPVTWTHYIAAEEMDWDYAPVKPPSLDR